MTGHAGWESRRTAGEPPSAARCFGLCNWERAERPSARATTVPSDEDATRPRAACGPPPFTRSSRRMLDGGENLRPPVDGLRSHDDTRRQVRRDGRVALSAARRVRVPDPPPAGGSSRASPTAPAPTGDGAVLLTIRVEQGAQGRHRRRRATRGGSPARHRLPMHGEPRRGRSRAGSLNPCSRAAVAPSPRRDERRTHVATSPAWTRRSTSSVLDGEYVAVMAAEGSRRARRLLARRRPAGRTPSPPRAQRRRPLRAVRFTTADH